MNGLSRWKIVFYLVGIFAAGAVSGWVLGTKTKVQRMFTPPPPDEIARRYLASLEERLHLTPEQVESLRRILDENARQIRTLHEKHMKAIWDAVSEGNKRILAQLTPDQQAEFKRMEDERRQEWQKRREEWRSRRGGRDHRRGPGPGPGPEGFTNKDRSFGRQGGPRPPSHGDEPPPPKPAPPMPPRP